MNTDRLIWIQPNPSTSSPCLVCGHDKDNKIILKASHWRKELGMMELAICKSCGSAFFIGADEKNSAYPLPDEVLRDPNFIYLIYHYLEIVGGLDWKVGLLEQLPFQTFKSVLEIGCNAGVALDYCRTVWGAETIGLEPSAYGILGGKLLGLPVISKYMHETDEIKDKKFDFIFATEVLEHVPDPLGFLLELRGHLFEEGVLLITTPRAGSVSPSTSPGELYAALSPGAHYFLLSPTALKSLVQKAGFSSCQASELGMMNVAVISDKPVKIGNPQFVHARIKEFYRTKKNLPNVDKRVSLGHLINYYNYASQSDDFEDELTTSSQINEALKSIFNISLSDPEALVNKMISANTLTAIGQVMPYSLPFYLNYRAQNLQSSRNSPFHYYELASFLAVQGLKVDFQNLFVYHALFDNALKCALSESRRPHYSQRSKNLLGLSIQVASGIPELQVVSPGIPHDRTSC